MNGQCSHFLAGPALAEQQHGRCRGGDLADETEDALHLRTRAEHVLEDIGTSRLLHFPVLSFEFDDIKTTLEDQGQLIQVHRLAQEIVGTSANRLERIFLVALT